MADQESEKLCAKLTGVVADVPTNEFYNRFNLEGHSFAEFYLKDMLVDIHHELHILLQILPLLLIS